jgi:hypothetical protein
MGIDIVYGRESSWFLGVVSSGVVEGVRRYIPYICLTSSDFADRYFIEEHFPYHGCEMWLSHLAIFR